MRWRWHSVIQATRQRVQILHPKKAMMAALLPWTQRVFGCFGKVPPSCRPRPAIGTFLDCHAFLCQTCSTDLCIR